MNSEELHSYQDGTGKKHYNTLKSVTLFYD